MFKYKFKDIKKKSELRSKMKQYPKIEVKFLTKVKE